MASWGHQGIDLQAVVVVVVVAVRGRVRTVLQLYQPN